jgi:hypothetical protein
MFNDKSEMNILSLCEKNSFLLPLPFSPQLIIKILFGYFSWISLTNMLYLYFSHCLVQQQLHNQACLGQGLARLVSRLHQGQDLGDLGHLKQ